MADPVKRILVLVTDAFGGFGGIAKFNRDLLTALCLHPDIKEVVAIPRLMNEEAGPVPNKLTLVTDGINNRGKYIAIVLKELLKNRKFDLIICGHLNLLPVGALCRIVSHAPLMLVIHGIDAWQPTKSTMVNWLTRSVDAFIAVSRCTRDRFLNWSGLPSRKGYILPNCISPDDYGVGPKSPELLRRYGLEGKTVLMTMGRMAKEEQYKGFDEVLEVMPDLLKKTSTLVYLVIGDGSDRRRLEKKALRLGLGKHVIFTGRIADGEKAEHLRLADVFVMPGRGEGFGIVYLEAMACGVPVIGSKLDGSRDALRDGELGILVNPDNLDEIKAAIHSKLNDSKKIPPGLEYFSFVNFRQRLHAIFNETISQP